MEFALLLEILKYGGPVLALSAMVIALMDRHLRSLLKLLGNHLTHTEAEQKETNRLLTILVDRSERKE